MSFFFIIITTLQGGQHLFFFSFQGEDLKILHDEHQSFFKIVGSFMFLAYIGDEEMFSIIICYLLGNTMKFYRLFVCYCFL